MIISACGAQHAFHIQCYSQHMCLGTHMGLGMHAPVPSVHLGTYSNDTITHLHKNTSDKAHIEDVQ